MKKTQEILGLPIISIEDGAEVGLIKDIAINADTGAIDFIVVDRGIYIINTIVISTNDILGIGKDAVTIKNRNLLMDIHEISEAIPLLKKNIRIKGTNVLTQKGRLIGKAGDILVDDENNCKIIGVEFISNNGNPVIQIIPREAVITFGENLIIVVEDIENNFLQNIKQITLNYQNLKEDLKEDLKEIKAEKIIEEVTEQIAEKILKEEVIQIEEEKEEKEEEQKVAVNIEVEEATVNGTNNIETLDTENVLSESSSSTVNLFEERQKQYLIGKKATKTIISNTGDIIINNGEALTEEIIDFAKSNGKLIELVMNNNV